MLDFDELKPVQALAASVFYRHKRLLLALPRQEGKTELGVRILRDITVRPFASSSLFLAKDSDSGKRATREKFQRLYDKKIFEVNTEQVYLKENPSSVIFMGSVDKEPARLRGGTYDVVHWSEVAFSKIEKGETITGVFDKIVQPTLRKSEGYAFLESTMNGKNGWKDIWDDYKTYGFARLKIGLSDMVYLGLMEPEEYEKIQATTHPDVFKQEYECDWVTFQGKAYNEFDHRIHVEEIPGPKDWQMVIAAMDWGYWPGATSILFAYVQDEVVHIFDEHYAHHELASITGDHINAKKAAWRINRLALTADHEADRIEELRLRGIPCGLADKANVMGARMQIKELFYFRKIKIHPRCKNLIRDLDSATWDVKHDGEIDYKMCSWGHYDAEAALRYLVRELSGVESKKPEENPQTDSVSQSEWEMRRRLHGIK